MCVVVLHLYWENINIEEFPPNYLILHRTNYTNKYRRSTLVILRCSKSKATRTTSLPLTEQVCKRFGINIEWADCNPRTNHLEGRDTGIMLRWIIANYHRLLSGEFERILRHHAHENSWHQSNLSGQLEQLFRAPEYLYGNKYGDIYANYIQHPLVQNNGKWDYWYQRGWHLSIMEKIVTGTRMEHFNRTNRYKMFRGGQSSAFFISPDLITQYPVEDYKRMLENTVEVVKILPMSIQNSEANYLVGEIVERCWQVLFTNKTWPEYRVPPPDEWGNMTLFNFSTVPVTVEYHPINESYL